MSDLAISQEIGWISFLRMQTYTFEEDKISYANLVHVCFLIITTMNNKQHMWDVD